MQQPQQYPIEPNEGIPAPEPITLLTLLNAVLRQRRLILVVTLACVGIAVVRSLFVPQSYVATGSFSPSTPSTSSTLSGFASQLGVDISDKSASQSPAFYADLLKSRPLLQTVVQAQYSVVEGGHARKQSLIDILGVDGSTPAMRLERAVVALRTQMQVSVSQKTGVITYSVNASSPELAAQVAQNVLAAVNDFNVGARRGSASAERQFTEKRVGDVRGELAVAEARLLSFQQTNRSVGGDPALQLQQNRLSREVERLQGIYATLSQSYENAKIDEVRDTPAITIIEHPERSVLPAPRGRVTKVIVAMVFGLALALILAFLRDIIARNQESDRRERDEFIRLRSELLRDLRIRRRRPAAST